MRKKAIVLEKNGDMTKISVLRHSVCSKCGACAGNNKETFMIMDKSPLAPGDMVEVEISDRFLILSSIIVYIFPLIALFLGYIVGRVLSVRFFNLIEYSEALGIVSSLIFLGISFPLLRVLGKFMDSRGFLEPRITKVFNDRGYEDR